MDKLLPFGVDEDSFRKCSMTDEEIARSPYMPHFDTKAFESEITRQCLGKEVCYAQVPRRLFLSLPAEL